MVENTQSKFSFKNMNMMGCSLKNDIERWPNCSLYNLATPAVDNMNAQPHRFELKIIFFNLRLYLQVINMTKQNQNVYLKKKKRLFKVWILHITQNHFVPAAGSSNGHKATVS